jgi:DivIVA domain-containing protein
MLVAAVVALIGLAVVCWALYAEQPLAPPGPSAPEWAGVPTPADIVRADFPMAFPGYDPASVETHLDAVARAYGDLVAVAPSEVLERARRRTLVRLGLADHADDDTLARPTTASTLVGADAADDREALRAAAALGVLDPPPDA